ncbi:MAG: hypothetical protein HUU21_31305, partial [Polyangiaceae bacterium]|nr:hypothetical protein [Polyangiaceae bacterium]
MSNRRRAVDRKPQGSAYRFVAGVLLAGLVCGGAASACAESDTVTSTGGTGTSTETSSGGRGGEGGEGGKGG